MFNIIEGAQCVLSKRGVYKQCKVYSFNGFIYAGISGGYVLLTKTGTSVPDIGIHTKPDIEVEYDRFDKMKKKVSNA